jgi:prostaglandin-endoperoxide synthase 2
VTAFDQISSDPELQAGLRDLCRDVDRIELYTGLFAEDTRPNSVLPALIGRLVAVDAFSQALTNPLLSPRVFTRRRSRRSGWRSSAPRPRCRTSCTATSRRARGATSSP